MTRFLVIVKLKLPLFVHSTSQPISFFDSAENSPARLASKLSSDAALVKGAAGEALGTALEGVFAVGAAIAISLDASWRLGLVVLAVFPLLAFAAVFEFRSSAGIAGGSGDALEASLEVASEAATAIRTVAAFNLQWRTLNRFGTLLKATVSAAIRQGSVSGGGRGISQFVSLASYSLAFWAGAIFIQRGEMPREALLKVFLAGASQRRPFLDELDSQPNSNSCSKSQRPGHWSYYELHARRGSRPGSGPQRFQDH